jgi:hypothetical protein
MLQAERLQFRFLTMLFDFFIYLILQAALESTQPLLEISTRDLPQGKEQPTYKSDNLSTTCEPVV